MKKLFLSLISILFPQQIPPPQPPVTISSLREAALYQRLLEREARGVSKKQKTEQPL